MKILVGYDGSNSAKEALNLAKTHAKLFGATVDVITSMEKGTEGQREQIEQAEHGLVGLFPAALDHGKRVGRRREGERGNQEQGHSHADH